MASAPGVKGMGALSATTTVSTRNSRKPALKRSSAAHSLQSCHVDNRHSAIQYSCRCCRACSITNQVAVDVAGLVVPREHRHKNVPCAVANAIALPDEVVILCTFTTWGAGQNLYLCTAHDMHMRSITAEPYSKLGGALQPARTATAPAT